MMISEQRQGLRIVLEVVMLVLLLGSVIGGAAFSVRQLHILKLALQHEDLNALLEQADEQIDGPLLKALESGDILLLKSSWLLSDAAHIVRRQDMPPEAFYSKEEAAELLKRKDRSVLVLSWRWLIENGAVPKENSVLSALQNYLRKYPNEDGLGIFFEYALPGADPA